MADTKLTALTATTAIDGTELLYVVEDPAGSPLSRKVLASDFKTYTSAGVGGTPAGSDTQFQYNNATAFGGANLWRIDANTIEQHNSTTSQVFRIYASRTDASNYERLNIEQGAGTFSIFTKPLGSGNKKSIYINCQDTSGNVQAGIRLIQDGSWGLYSGTTAELTNVNSYIETVKGFKVSGSTNGLGYASGTGGAVTQLTSRTTGVTLNKSCGAITLFSTTPSATFQTFTVTNSAVAATDVVIVSQKSGTDLYDIAVTAVAAGSFNISCRSTGSTTEQPVFNFAVIRAVAS